MRVNCVFPVCVFFQSAAAAPSPVMGNMPPNDGMPGGPMPPGFFQVRETTFSLTSSLSQPHLHPSHHTTPDSPSAPPSASAKPILLSPPPFLASLAVLIPVQMCSLLCVSASVPYVHALVAGALSDTADTTNWSQKSCFWYLPKYEMLLLLASESRFFLCLRRGEEAIFSGLCYLCY